MLAFSALSMSVWSHHMYATGGNPGFALTSHSSSLVTRFTSPINPRAIIFTPALAAQRPTTPKPKKRPDQGCGMAGQFILMVVAMVVAAYVMPLALQAVGVTSGLIADAGFGQAFAAGMITGAASSIVSQGVGLITGIQSKFNWGAVAMNAIGSRM